MTQPVTARTHRACQCSHNIVVLGEGLHDQAVPHRCLEAAYVTGYWCYVAQCQRCGTIRTIHTGEYEEEMA